MFLVKVEVRPSTIDGKGVFLVESAKKGDVLLIYTYGNSELIEKKTYDFRYRHDDRDVMQSGLRYINNWFIYDNYMKYHTSFGNDDGDFVNHSFNPTMIYHCGICFAKRNLQAGDELTIDYRYVFSDTVEVMTDSMTGQKVKGLSGKESFLHSLRDLYQLFFERQYS